MFPALLVPVADRGEKTHPQTDIATYRQNRPWDRFSKNPLNQDFFTALDLIVNVDKLVLESHGCLGQVLD